MSDENRYALELRLAALEAENAALRARLDEYATPPRPLGMPQEAYAAYQKQRNRARARGVPFEFSPEDWWAWWQTDDRWSRRGRGLNDLVMARIGDTGPYRTDNVYCASNHQNSSDASRNLKKIGGGPGRRPKLNERQVAIMRGMVENSTMTKQQIADTLGISRFTLYEYLRRA